MSYSEEKVTYVVDKTVKCEGEAKSVGHPLIYMEFGERTELTCPYCSHVFKLKV